MRAALFAVALAVCAAGVLLVAATEAQADANAGACASTAASSAGATRVWRVSTPADSANASCITQQPTEGFLQNPGGDGVTLVCNEFTTGATPPGAPTSLTISFHEDDSYFDILPENALFTRAAPTCNNGNRITVYCTDDGTVSGDPIFGLIRLRVRAVRTTVLTYDVNSDTDALTSDSWGAFRCLTTIDGWSENTDQFPGVFVPMDTYATEIVLGGAYANSSRSFGDGRAGCQNRVTQDVAALSGAGTVFGWSHRVDGPQSGTWVHDCTVAGSLLRTPAALVGFTDQPRFGATTALTNVTFANSAWHYNTTQLLDRRYTLSDVQSSRFEPPFQNVTLFAIPDDDHFARARGVTDARDAFAVGTVVTCQRTPPGGPPETPFALPATDALGNTGVSAAQAVTTPEGTWDVTCYVDGENETVAFAVTVDFLTSEQLSPFATVTAAVFTDADGVIWGNFTARVWAWNLSTVLKAGTVNPADGVFIGVRTLGLGAGAVDDVFDGVMAPLSGGGFYANVTVPDPGTWLSALVVVRTVAFGETVQAHTQFLYGRDQDDSVLRLKAMSDFFHQPVVAVFPSLLLLGAALWMHANNTGRGPATSVITTLGLLLATFAVAATDDNLMDSAGSFYGTVLVVCLLGLAVLSALRGYVAHKTPGGVE